MVIMHARVENISNIINNRKQLMAVDTFSVQIREKFAFSTNIDIKPYNRFACPVSFIISNVGYLCLLIGESLNIEENDLIFENDTSLINSILLCVIQGKVFEKIWYNDRRIVRSEARAILGSYLDLEIARTDISYYNFFKTKKIIEKQYEPYIERC